MALDLQTVAQLLQATLDPQQHKQGTYFSKVRFVAFVCTLLIFYS